MGCPANLATSVASFLFLRFSQMCLATLLVETRNTTGMSSAAYYFSYYCFFYCAPLCIGASSATANVTPAHLARTNIIFTNIRSLNFLSFFQVQSNATVSLAKEQARIKFWSYGQQYYSFVSSTMHPIGLDTPSFSQWVLY